MSRIIRLGMEKIVAARQDFDAFDVDEMMEKVRKEVELRRLARGDAAMREMGSGPEDDWSALGVRISDLSRSAEMSTDIPDLAGVGMPKRYPLMRLGRLIMGLLGHLRERQSRFNREVTAALAILVDRGRGFEAMRAEIQQLREAQIRLEHDLRGAV
ncbi:MAG: hypothetical protein ACRDIU_11770, partial [Actinomycetota bacterium]